MSRSLDREGVEHLERYPINSHTAGQSGSGQPKKWKNLCKPSYQWRWFGNRGIGIVLLWSFAAFSLLSFYINVYVVAPTNGNRDHYFIIISVGSVFFPIVGVLTDVYIGRYRVIKACLIVMWIGAILLCMSYALTVTSVLTHLVSHYLAIFLSVIIGLALGCFQVNIVQFCVDQLLDSSSNEIISFIAWYVWTYFASKGFSEIIGCISYFNVMLFPTLFLSLVLTLAVSSEFLFGHWLVKEPVTHNPLKLIFKVLQYAVKHKYPRQRSAFTYWDDKRYSRLDLGKSKFGGPFTTEQVEDVKMYFRIQYLLVIGCAFIGMALYSGYDLSTLLSKFSGYCWIAQARAKVNVGECLKGVSVTYFGHLIIVLCIPFYEFFLLPVFRKCIPKLKIFTQMTIGGFIIVLHLVGLVAVEAVGQLGHHENQSNASESSCIKPLEINSYCDLHHIIPYYWFAILSLMFVIGKYLLIAAGMTFVSAQAPYSMKGLIFGSMYSNLGLVLVLMNLVFLPFFKTIISVRGVVMGCVFWFLLTCVVLSVVLAIVFVIASHCYKNRQRDHEDEDTV